MHHSLGTTLITMIVILAAAATAVVSGIENPVLRNKKTSSDEYRGNNNAVVRGRLCADITRCARVHKWNAQDRDFVSLLNVPITKLPDYNVSIVEGRTVRVAVDNMVMLPDEASMSTRRLTMLKPYVVFSPDSTDLSGYLGEMWKIIEDTLKFKSHVLPSMSYDDAFNLVENASADVMLGGVVFLRHIENAEFSQPYFQNWHHLYFKKPESRTSPSSYIRTLSTSVWLCSMGLFLFLTVTLLCSVKLLNHATFSKRKLSLLIKRKRLENTKSVSSYLLASICGFLHQGFDLKLKTNSCRIQILCALLFGFLLYVAMSALLVSELAVAEIKMPVSSMDDVVRTGKYSMCIRTNSFAYHNFTDKDRNVLPKWKGIVNGPGCSDINHRENISKVICNDDILVMENRAIMSAARQDFPPPCKVAYLPVRFFQKANCYLYSKTFRQKHIISNYVKRLRGAGILKKLENKWVRRAGSESARTQAPQITFYHITGILSAYLVMVIVSFCILIAERLFHRYLHGNHGNEANAWKKKKKKMKKTTKRNNDEETLTTTMTTLMPLPFVN